MIAILCGIHDRYDDDLVDTTSTCYGDNHHWEPEEWEEVEVQLKNDKKAKFSVPKGSLDYDPRRSVPVYSAGVRVNNGRRR